MRRSVLAIIVIIVSLGAILGYMVWHPPYLFTETLPVGETEDRGDGMYVIPVYDKSGGDVAHIVFITGMIVLPGQNMTSIRLSIWHKPGTQLDSLQISFEPSPSNHHIEAYLGTPPGGRWNPITTDSSGLRHVFSFPDLGFYGSATLTLYFLVYKFAGSTTITIKTYLALHDTTSPIVFTKQQATSSLTL